MFSFSSFFLPLFSSFSSSLLAPQGRKIFGGVPKRCRDVEVGNTPPKIGIGKEEGGGTRRKRRKKSEVKVGDFFCGARFFLSAITGGFFPRCVNYKTHCSKVCKLQEDFFIGV